MFKFEINRDTVSGREVCQLIVAEAEGLWNVSLSCYKNRYIQQVKPWVWRQRNASTGIPSFQDVPVWITMLCFVLVCSPEDFPLTLHEKRGFPNFTVAQWGKFVVSALLYVNCMAVLPKYHARVKKQKQKQTHKPLLYHADRSGWIWYAWAGRLRQQAQGEHSFRWLKMGVKGIEVFETTQI